MKSILLIRHAETALNASRVIQFPDTPLSSRGRWQAERLAARLRQSGVTHVVSSDYRRAKETAERICETTQATMALDEQLRERHLGELRGRPYSEVRDQVFAEDFAPETGETWTAFNRRIDLFWQRVETLGAAVDGGMALVTHGLVCGAIVRRHLSLADRQEPLRFPNTSVTIVDPEPPWPVRVFACDTHLQ